MHAGDGRGGLQERRAIGKGWHGMDALLGTGDFSGDGRPDLVARTKDGSLWQYRGDGSGGFAGSGRIGKGWGSLSLVG